MLAADPVVWVRIEEGSGAVLADARGGPSLQIVQPASWVPPRPGSDHQHALRFVGGHATSSPTDSVPAIDALTTQLSASAWLYWDEPNTDRDQAVAGTMTWNLRLGGTSFPHLCMAISTSNGQFSHCGERVPLKTWTHVAVTWDGTELRLFMAGVQSGPAKRVTGRLLTSWQGPFGVGGWGDGGDPILGVLDDVRVYDRALTPTEIASLAR